jgi:CcmD family protein
MRRQWIATALVVFVLALGVGVAAAGAASARGLGQTAAQPQGGQGEFVPVKDLPQQEKMPAAPLVMGAYGFVWVTLLVYVWSLWRRVGAVQREITDLRRRVERKA